MEKKITIKIGEDDLKTLNSIVALMKKAGTVGVRNQSEAIRHLIRNAPVILSGDVGGVRKNLEKTDELKRDLSSVDEKLEKLINNSHIAGALVEINDQLTEMRREMVRVPSFAEWRTRTVVEGMVDRTDTIDKMVLKQGLTYVRRFRVIPDIDNRERFGGYNGIQDIDAFKAQFKAVMQKIMSDIGG